MLNKIKEGKSIDITLAVITAGGLLVAIGDLHGVTTSGGKIGDTVSVQLEGVFEVPKAIGAGSGFPQGTVLYFDPATNGVTEIAGSLKRAGHANKLAGDNDTKCHLRLVQ